MKTTNKQITTLYTTVFLVLPLVSCFNKPTAHQRADLLEGAPNFRDLGGYPSHEGKKTVWGKIFRTQALDQLTDNDIKKMKEIGVKTVIDFRDDEEVKRAPSRLLEGVNVIRLPIGVGSHISKSMQKQFLSMDSLQCIRFMEGVNRQFAMKFTKSFKAFFDVLLQEENYPVVFHCTAGKDRTGFAAAMLLCALDVDWNTVMEDYLLSNTYLEPQSFLPPSEQISPALRMIWSVQPSYLNNAKNEIIQRYGSIDNNLQKEFQIGQIEKEKLKNYLLE
jgi:protein-tyrosine phosphatase